MEKKRFVVILFLFIYVLQALQKVTGIWQGPQRVCGRGLQLWAFSCKSWPRRFRPRFSRGWSSLTPSAAAPSQTRHLLSCRIYDQLLRAHFQDTAGWTAPAAVGLRGRDRAGGACSRGLETALRASPASPTVNTTPRPRSVHPCALL
jgi:hypothetical protein